MKQYKVVPYAGTVVIKKKDKAQDAITKYFDVIAQECVDGWEFFSAVPVSVTRKKCGLRKNVEQYNAFIFVKEV
ncbi:MAG: hypothetical protein J5762_05285 [Clostridia bacterium]|nr:hypothetical protein [Clostridia bacterium]